MAIAPGTVGPGGARFGAGAGGPNRFDYTQYGGGLWSVGIDPNAPDVDAQVQRWFGAQPANVQAEVRKGMQGGKSLTWAADWRGRDVARKIQKENGFFQSTLGQVLGTALQVGASFIPGVGPLASAGIGALQGGLTGGFRGALLGGLSGYGVGKATQFVANGGLTALGRSLTGKAALGAANAVPGAATGVTTPMGGAALTGSGQAAKLAGLMGGAPLSASTLASGAATGTGVFSKLFGASKTPTAQALGAASSVAGTVRRLAAPTGITGAALLAAGGLLGPGGSSALQPTALTPGASPLAATQPTGYETAREQARAGAAGAVGDSDMVRTTPLGLVGKPRTRGKKLLGM